MVVPANNSQWEISGFAAAIAGKDARVDPEGMAVSHDSKWAVTTSETTNMVHWIDVAELEVIKSIPVGRFPWGVAVKP